MEGDRHGQSGENEIRRVVEREAPGVGRAQCAGHHDLHGLDRILDDADHLGRAFLPGGNRLVVGYAAKNHVFRRVDPGNGREIVNEPTIEAIAPGDGGEFLGCADVTLGLAQFLADNRTAGVLFLGALADRIETGLFGGQIVGQRRQYRQ